MLRLKSALFCVMCISASACAQEIAGKGEEAEALAKDGKFVEAAAALDDAVSALWDKAPLTFRRAIWVETNAGGFGVYSPRASNAYAAGAQMFAYVEPIGLGWRQSGDTWNADLVTDLVVKAKGGQELLRQNAFSRTKVSSRAKNHEFFASFVYTVSGLPPGEYVIDTIMHDEVSGKNATFSLPFIVQ